jgi:hypothetical protein
LKVWTLDDRGNSLNILILRSNVISMDWDKKTNKILYLGTLNSSLKVYDINQKKVIQELEFNKSLPNVTHICCSLSLNGELK